MNKIDAIVVHCSATRAGQDVRAADIDKWHKERGGHFGPSNIPLVAQVYEIQVGG